MRPRGLKEVRGVVLFGFLILTFFTSENSSAFPDMIRHGYINCSSCHLSSSGGDMLTDYGRALSKELLSRGQWFFERGKKIEAKYNSDRSETSPEDHSKNLSEDFSEKFFSDSMDLPEWLRLGGNLRLFQAFQETPTDSSARFFLMQADLDALVVERNLIQVFASVGRVDPHLKDGQWTDFVISRAHWLKLALGPAETRDRSQLRIGRFFPAYGIQVPEHFYVTRKLLGFDQGQERYNIEWNYQETTWTTTATLIAAATEQVQIKPETGLILQATRAFGSTYKLGINGYWNHKKDADLWQNHSTYGLFGLLGFSPTTYALVENNWTHTDANNQWGYIELCKLGWEFTQGLQVFSVQEYANLDMQYNNPHIDAFTLGLQYLPRTHWDLSGYLREERNTSVFQEFQTLVGLMLHYYL